jgi:small multidrug resistance pump
MRWLLLYVAIVFEVAGTTSLKASEGMARLDYFALCLGLYAVSFALLGLSLTTIPVGVAYAVWSGLGTVLVVLIGVYWFAEPVTLLRGLFIAMIVLGAIGLNLSTDAH